MIKNIISFIQFHSFLDFLVLVDFSSHPLTAIFFFQHNGLVPPSPSLIAFFVVFLDFLIDHECHHSFVLLLKSELLCWAIVLSPYIIIVFLPEQWHSFAITVVGCYILNFSMITTLPWLQALVGMDYYTGNYFLIDKIIAMHHDFFLWAKWRHFIVIIFDCYTLKFFYHWSSQMSATTCSDHFLHWNYFY